MTTTRARLLVLGLVSLATASLAVSDVGATGRVTSTPPSTPAPPAGGPVTLSVGSTTLGDVVVDGTRMTLYVFTPDRAATSTCTGDCLKAWPALAGPAAGANGVDSADLGTITRPDDQSKQVTFYGWPMYTFAGDQAPGDTAGQGKGGKWFLVDGRGMLVTATEPPATPSTAAGSAPMTASTEAAGSAGTSAGSAPATVSTVQLASTPFGTVAVDGNGRSLYAFVPDLPATSVCVDKCAAAWPPLVGQPSAGAGIDPTLVGTIIRPDGSTQVTYRGWPLYTFEGDAAAGDVTGQGVGGKWYVLDPSGEMISG